MGIMSFIESPVVGTVLGTAVGGAIGGGGFPWGEVAISSLDPTIPTLKLQFNPDWSEDYENNINSFVPPKGMVVYPIFSSRNRDEFSLSGIYYARTANEAVGLEQFAECLKNIAKPKNNELPIVGIDFPFKKKTVMVYVKSLSTKYSNIYVDTSSGGASASMLMGMLSSSGAGGGVCPKKLEFTFTFIEYNPLPTINASQLSGLPASTNWDVSDTHKGDRCRKGSSAKDAMTDEEMAEQMKQLTEEGTGSSSNPDTSETWKNE